jgi:hypothetical protein
MTKQNPELIHPGPKGGHGDLDFWQAYVLPSKQPRGLIQTSQRRISMAPAAALRLYIITARLQELGIKHKPNLASNFSILRGFLYAAFETSLCAGETV